MSPIKAISLYDIRFSKVSVVKQAKASNVTWPTPDLWATSWQAKRAFGLRWLFKTVSMSNKVTVIRFNNSRPWSCWPR